LGVSEEIKDSNLIKNGFLKIKKDFSFLGNIRELQLESGFH
jgi:hypothetical protein